MIRHGSPRRTRVKVITDPVTYRQHRRHKWLRRLKRVGASLLVLLIVFALLWLAFQFIGRAPAPG